MAFMRPGRAVVEIGYDSFRSGGMKYPLSYFMAIARSVGLEYYVSIARGSYGGPMTANVADILLLVKEAVAKVKMLPIGAGAWPTTSTASTTTSTSTSSTSSRSHAELGLVGSSSLSLSL